MTTLVNTHERVVFLYYYILGSHVPDVIFNHEVRDKRQLFSLHRSH